MWLTLEPHLLQSSWRLLDFETDVFQADDTMEAIALRALTTFYGFHPLEMLMHPLGLFPTEQEDDPMWRNTVSHAKHVRALHPEQAPRVAV